MCPLTRARAFADSVFKNCGYQADVMFWFQTKLTGQQVAADKLEAKKVEADAGGSFFAWRRSGASSAGLFG